jgi:hypothetical protein
MDALVRDHISQRKLAFSLSVFEAEAGTAGDAVMTRQQLSELMQLQKLPWLAAAVQEHMQAAGGQPRPP